METKNYQDILENLEEFSEDYENAATKTYQARETEGRQGSGRK